MVDLGPLLGLEPEGDNTPYSGIEVWVLDAHRPWNLANVFGGFPLEPETDEATSYQTRSPVGVKAGEVGRAYKSNKGGIVVFDDGDIEADLSTERGAYLALLDMPDFDDDGQESVGSISDDDDDEGSDNHQDNTTLHPARAGQKRKSWSDGNGDDSSDDDEDRPHQRRRSNSVRYTDPDPFNHPLT